MTALPAMKHPVSDAAIVAADRIGRAGGDHARYGFISCLPWLTIDGRVIYAPPSGLAAELLRELASPIGKAGYRVVVVER